MSDLELKVEKLIKDQILITESEAQDLAYLICELPEIKGGRVGAEVMAENNDLKKKVEEQCSDCIHNFNELYPRPKDNDNWCGFLVQAQYPCMKKI